jgi:hypothetical protein
MLRNAMRKKLGLWVLTLSVVFGALAPVSITAPTASAPASVIIRTADAQSVEGEGGAFTTSISRNDEGDYYLYCGGTDILCGLVKFTNLLLEGATSILTFVAGGILDFSLDFTLSSQNYKQNVNGFIEGGWRIVRDITNLIFIFGLIYAAFALIVGATSSTMGRDPKKIVVWIIVMALLVNFSMFFARVVIDVGNIFGRAFYDRITVTQSPDNTDSVYQTNPNVKPVSKAVLEKVNIQAIYSNVAVSFNTGLSWVAKITFIVFLSLVMFMFNLFLIYIFATSAGFIFARTIGLWFAMILSPMAFALYAVPINNPTVKKYLGFEGWMETLVSMAFQVPIFLFFFYIAMKVIELKINFPVIDNNDFGVTNVVWLIIQVMLQLAVVGTIIMLGKKFAKDMSGMFGEMVANVTTAVASAAGGLALGAATGGAAFLGRQVAGRAGSAVASSSRLGQGLQSNNWFKRNASRAALQMGQRMEKGSYDVRNTGAIGGINKGIGKLNNVLPSQLGKIGTIDDKGALAVGQRTGGYREIAEARSQATLEKEKKQAEADKKLLDRVNEDRIKEGKKIQEGIATEKEIRDYIESDPKARKARDDMRSDPKTMEAAAKALGKTITDVTEKELDDYVKAKIEKDIGAVSSKATDEEKARDDMGEAKTKLDETSKSLKEVTRDADELAKNFSKPVKEIISLRSQLNTMLAEKTEIDSLAGKEKDAGKKSALQKRSADLAKQIDKNIKKTESKESKFKAGDSEKIDLDNHKELLENIDEEYKFAVEENAKKKVEYDSKRIEHSAKQRDLAKAKQADGYKIVTDSIKAAEKAGKDLYKNYAVAAQGRMEDEYLSRNRLGTALNVANVVGDIATFTGFSATNEGKRRAAVYYRDQAKGKKSPAPKP